ncbi:MAG: EamA family transporter, partial [Pseudomonadota bacterium]|nr:EamA family transporter [Pseudomonadota bacterium]
MRLPIFAALVSALLFGVSTPVAKVLVAQVPPVALAGLLYLGAGVGLIGLRWARRRGRGLRTPREAPVKGTDWGWMKQKRVN